MLTYFLVLFFAVKVWIWIAYLDRIEILSWIQIRIEEINIDPDPPKTNVDPKHCFSSFQSTKYPIFSDLSVNKI